jgi:hypothetical protein
MNKADIYYLFYHSFGHAQGRLVLQIDFFSYVALLWKEQGIQLNAALESELQEQLFSFQPPQGHQIVDTGEVKAQFQFWWETMWDIFKYYQIVSNESTLPISVERLQARALRWSGEDAYYSNRYSSLRGDKMQKLVDRFTMNASKSTYGHILAELLLPNILSVESYFQGEPRYSEDIGRQRIDSGDKFESRFRTYCLTALRKQLKNEKLNIFDEIYLKIVEYLDDSRCAKEPNPCTESYKRLIELYNQNHPTALVENLHTL